MIDFGELYGLYLFLVPCYSYEYLTGSFSCKQHSVVKVKGPHGFSFD